MLDRPGIKTGLQVGLIGDDAVDLITRVDVAGDGPCRRVVGVGRHQLRAAGHECRKQIVLLGFSPARGVLQFERRREIMFDARGGHVGGCVIVIGVGAVEILGIDAGCAGQKRAILGVGRGIARQPHGQHTAVGHVALFDVQEIQEHARVGVQAKCKRRRNAPTVVLDLVAPGNARVETHHVQTERRAAHTGQLLVPIDGSALEVAASRTQRAIETVAQARLLAEQIDRAGGCGATKVRTRWTLEDFDLLDVEHVTRDRPQVAYAVDVDAARRIKAAHEHRIAGAGVAVLTRVEGARAGHVAQRFGQRGRTLLAHQLFLDDGDRLRGVHQRLGELGGGQVFGRSEGRFGSVGDSHLLERRRGGLLLLSVRQRCCHRKSGQGGKQAARGDTAQRGVFAASNICVGVRHDED